MEKCPGDGRCLGENFSCSFNCQLIPCSNYKLCQNNVHKWALYDSVCFSCFTCFITFKGLKGPTYINNIECPICLETSEGVLAPNCSHSLCIDCYRKYYGLHQIPYIKDILLTYKGHDITKTCPLCRK